jgi:hypothetical protein
MTTPKNQKELFRYIWETRPHVSEVSGKPLLEPHEFKWHWQFAHILNKGRFPSLRLDPRNIILLLPEEHEQQDQYEEFQVRKQKLMKEYYENN